MAVELYDSVNSTNFFVASMAEAEALIAQLPDQFTVVNAAVSPPAESNGYSESQPEVVPMPEEMAPTAQGGVWYETWHQGVFGMVQTGVPGSFVPMDQAAGLDLRTEATPVSLETEGSNGYAEAPAALGTAVVLLSVVLSRLPLLRTAIVAFVGRYAIGGRVAWAALPTWFRAALTRIGIPAGTVIVVDSLVDGGGDGGFLGFGGGEHPDIPGVHLGAHVVGSWVANGVTFYRLSDGKLAVQNKHGRWKVWRPKKPIVLYSSGAVDLKTLIRADAVLNRQAKKIANLLNRRARPRKAPKTAEKQTVIIADGHHVS